ncbi:hypothetical protein PoB_005717900 [Plakobranchus ocellatus]|uniref:Uncharacterized protein n=1 Tax=Plakobranchus ocellatus TaxID=259542 RepID=A0AAV4CIM3_9GAST|nr:hypothetical protein PoB_005717900 [Plakobranchus ocellatus]
MVDHGALVSKLKIDRAGPQNSGTYVCRSSHNVLRDILVQVLVADSSNKKRGTASSTSSSNTSARESAGPQIQLSTSCLLLVIALVTYRTLHV